MSIIIERLCNIIIITHEPLDYILIEDIMKEYQDMIIEKNYNEKTIKHIIFEYLKKNVNIENYSSKVFGKYNKRGYIGIIWKDSNRIENEKKHYHFYKYYNIKNLIENESDSKDFINKIDNMIQSNDINWPPMNIVYYIRVLIKDEIRFFLEEHKKLLKDEIMLALENYKPILKDENKVNNKIERKKGNLNNIDFINFLELNIMVTENEKDILFTKDILLKYEDKTKSMITNEYNYYLSKFILERFCDNNINILEKKYKYRTKEKRGYRYLKLKENV